MTDIKPKIVDGERMAPVQGCSVGIPWSMHIRAWDVYDAKWRSGQSAERIAERGGFHIDELDSFIPGWREEISELSTLRARVAELEAELKQYRDAPTPDEVIEEVEVATERLDAVDPPRGVQIPDNPDHFFSHSRWWED